MLKFQIVPLFLIKKMIIKGSEFSIGDAYVIKKLHPSIILILAIFLDATSSFRLFVAVEAGSRAHASIIGVVVFP